VLLDGYALYTLPSSYGTPAENTQKCGLKILEAKKLPFHVQIGVHEGHYVRLYLELRQKVLFTEGLWLCKFIFAKQRPVNRYIKN
jgi:hypothetical protein